jgi:uncharacterized phosphatase
MTEICLVRHGQTDWNFSGIIQGREDIPLNIVGKEQARQSAEFLSKEKWDMIISSPLSRALETAKAIAEFTKLDEILEDQRFIERDFGQVSGKNVSEYRNKYNADEIENIETMNDLITRTFSALEDVAKNNEGKRIIIVAHSHTIKSILHAIDSEKVNFETKLNNACASYVEYKDNGWSIKAFNVSDHITI